MSYKIEQIVEQTGKQLLLSFVFKVDLFNGDTSDV